VVGWRLAGSAVKCELADGPGIARASGRAHVGRGPNEVAGVLLTGQVGTTPTRTRTGLGLRRARRAGWNRDSDPAEPTTRQVHGVSHVLILPLDSAARLGPRVQPAIPASGVNPSASSAKAFDSDRSLLALLICSLFFSPVSPILANTVTPGLHHPLSCSLH
jgi:hypothetical protein